MCCIQDSGRPCQAPAEQLPAGEQAAAAGPIKRQRLNSMANPTATCEARSASEQQQQQQPQEGGQQPELKQHQQRQQQPLLQPSASAFPTPAAHLAPTTSRPVFDSTGSSCIGLVALLQLLPVGPDAVQLWETAGQQLDARLRFLGLSRCLAPSQLP